MSDEPTRERLAESVKKAVKEQFRDAFRDASVRAQETAEEMDEVSTCTPVEGEKKMSSEALDSLYEGLTMDIGFNVVFSPHAVRTVKRERGIMERLFTIPWRPFKREKEVERPAVYMLTPTTGAPLFESGYGRHTFVVHPSLKDRFEDAAGVRGEEREWVEG